MSDCVGVGGERDQILGLNGVPVAGDEFEVVGSLDEARSRAAQKAEQLRGMRLALQAGEGKVTLASLTAGAQEGQVSGALERHVVNLVVKVDAQVRAADLPPRALTFFRALTFSVICFFDR